MSDFDDYRSYFGEYLPGLYGQQLMEELKSLNASLEFVVKDSGDPPWRIAVEQGKLVHVGHEGPEPTCRFETDLATFLRLVKGEETPQEAFFDFRVEMTGDLEKALILSAALEAFHERFPYRPKPQG